MGFLKRFFRNVFRDGSPAVHNSSFERLSEEELEAHLGVVRYGEFVLYRPPFKSTTLFLWAGPFIFLLIGATTLFVYLRRRRQQIEDEEPVLTEQQRKQAEALLKEGEGKNA